MRGWLGWVVHTVGMAGWCVYDIKRVAVRASFSSRLCCAVSRFPLYVRLVVVLVVWDAAVQRFRGFLMRE